MSPLLGASAAASTALLLLLWCCYRLCCRGLCSGLVGGHSDGTQLTFRGSARWTQGGGVSHDRLAKELDIIQILMA